MRVFALVAGVLYLLVGLAGLWPHILIPEPEQPLLIETLHGRLFGVFPVNIVHDLVHIVIGIAGLIAFRSFTGARMFARSVAVLYGLLTILGLIPFSNTLFGLVPINGLDIALHAATAGVAALLGWGARKIPHNA
jgi:uncharacterized membrane protein YuzA (DUF378 family)